ncbi:MAG TPA: hypothetical protein VGO76_03220 [Luteibacter sp.]|jgi:hypothetical protein|nr:hypothetical protein [Luteibacter sp.]
MPANELPDGTIDDSGKIYLNCLCGRCTIDANTNDDDLSLDSCLHVVHDMLGAVEGAIPRTNAGAHIALQSIHGLLTSARLQLCEQRQGARAGGSDGL